MTTTPSSKKIIIVGATSGIGRAMAEMFAQNNYLVGITGRRAALLEEIRQQYPEHIHTQEMDIRSSEAVEQLQQLVTAMGGMDILFINSGYGKELPELEPEMELQTVDTNVKGFTNIMVFGYNYFKQQKGGQIVVTSSVAGVRGLRQSPAYSASKRYMNQYVDSLAQRANHEKIKLKFTTLMPGFIATDFLTGHNYPLVVPLSKVTKTIYRAIVRKKRAIYLPCRWNFIVILWRLIPKRIWEKFC